MEHTHNERMQVKEREKKEGEREGGREGGREGERGEGERIKSSYKCTHRTVTCTCKPVVCTCTCVHA